MRCMMGTQNFYLYPLYSRIEGGHVKALYNSLLAYYCTL